MCSREQTGHAQKGLALPGPGAGKTDAGHGANLHYKTNIWQASDTVLPCTQRTHVPAKPSWHEGIANPQNRRNSKRTTNESRLEGLTGSLLRQSQGAFRARNGGSAELEGQLTAGVR